MNGQANPNESKQTKIFSVTSPHQKKGGRAGKDVLGTVCLLHPYYTLFIHKGICTLPREDMQCGPGEKAIRSHYICTSLYLMSKLYKFPAYIV